MIIGPQDTPYQNGIFNLELFLTEKYPMEPPKVRFLTKIYHPNIGINETKNFLFHIIFPFLSI